MEGMTMTHTITAALAGSPRREDDMLRRDFLKTATATAVLTATLPVQAKETPTMSKENFADVNGQHIFYSVHGAGKPLILLHGGINPDSFGSNLAELAKGRQVIAVHLQAHGRTPDTDRPLRCETLGDDVAALIGHLNLGNTMWYKGSQARQTLRLAGGGPFFPPYPHTPWFLDGVAYGKGKSDTPLPIDFLFAS